MPGCATPGDPPRTGISPEGQSAGTDPKDTASMRVAAAACSFVLGVGFGFPGVAGALHLARTGEVWKFLGFPTYGGGPFERWGLPTSVVLIAGFVLVCAAELALGAMILADTPGTRRPLRSSSCPSSSPTGSASHCPSARHSASPGPCCCSFDRDTTNKAHSSADRRPTAPRKTSRVIGFRKPQVTLPRASEPRVEVRYLANRPAVLGDLDARIVATRRCV